MGVSIGGVRKEFCVVIAGGSWSLLLLALMLLDMAFGFSDCSAGFVEGTLMTEISNWRSLDCPVCNEIY